MFGSRVDCLILPHFEASGWILLNYIKHGKVVICVDKTFWRENSKMHEMRVQMIRRVPCQAIPLKTDTWLHMGCFYTVRIISAYCFGALSLHKNCGGMQLLIDVKQVCMKTSLVLLENEGFNGRGKQQQIVTLMHRHFSKEIMYSNSCFLWCFVVTFLFWWCENSSFFLSPQTSRPVLFWDSQHIL